MKLTTRFALGLLVGGLAACSGNDQQDQASSGAPGGGAGWGGGSAGGSAGGAMNAGMPASGTGGTTSAGGSGGGAGAGASAGSGSTEPPPPSGTGSGQLPQAGLLTAGLWDDNRNFNHFQTYLERLQTSSPVTGMLDLTVAEQQTANVAAKLTSHERLDIALILDTTGSMSDEMAYLKAEFSSIAGRIASLHPNAEQRWALIVYRDNGDQYVTRTFNFTGNIESFQSVLNVQKAAGGGDYPEASHEALAQANQLTWRSDSDVARLAFWVADAPHHYSQAEAMSKSLRTAAAQGIHLYPVASSGVNEATEYSLRSAAQITGGRYMFLTDDSGVGGEHKEPNLPCYFVTRLDDAMVRVVDIELGGTYYEPSAEEIIRTGGDPKDGACELSSGQTVFSF